MYFSFATLNFKTMNPIPEHLNSDLYYNSFVVYLKEKKVQNICWEENVFIVSDSMKWFPLKIIKLLDFQA